MRTDLWWVYSSSRNLMLRTNLSFILAMALCGTIWRNFATSAIGNFDHSYFFGHGFTGAWYTPHHVPFSCANNVKAFVHFFSSTQTGNSWFLLLLLQLLSTSSQPFWLQHGCYISKDTYKQSVRNATVNIRRSSLSALNLQLSSFYSIYCTSFWLLLGLLYHLSSCKVWSI